MRWMLGLCLLLTAYPAEAAEYKFTVLAVNRLDTSVYQAKDSGDVSECVWVTVEYTLDGVVAGTYGFLLPTKKPTNAPEATYGDFIKRLIKKRIRGFVDGGKAQTDRTPPLGASVPTGVGLSATVSR